MLSITPAKLIRSELFKKTGMRIILFVLLIIVVTVSCTFAYPSLVAWLFNVSDVDTSVRVNVVRFILVALCCSPMLAMPIWGVSRVGIWMHAHRFSIGIGIVILAVLLDINGSSMGWWNEFFGANGQDGVALGKPRNIRSDEYAVNTPFAFSQAYNDYGYFNSLIGNRDTDVFLIKDAPVWWIAEIFRPFQWGYFIFGSSRGLAFYWFARLVFLVLCIYELLRLLTRDRRLLALIGTVLVAFSPIIQWWFAVNYLPEMLIAVSLSIILFYRYWDDDNFLRRVCYVVIICICAGMFVLSLYPACQIPLGYLLMALIAWVFFEQRHKLSLSWKDIIVLIVCVLFTALLLGSVLYMSWPTISASLNTVYPGNRTSVGGDLSLSSILNGAASMLYPFREYVGVLNAPETAQIVDLFPIGFVLAIYQLIRYKKKDFLSIALLIYCAVTGMYIIVGFPSWLSTITLMSMTLSSRCYLGFALANLFLLTRCVSRCSRIVARRKIVVGVLVVYAIGVTYASYINNSIYIGIKSMLAVAMLVFIIGYAVFYNLTRSGRIVSVVAIVAIVCSGAVVNPVQMSSFAITDQPLTNQVKAIQAEDPGVWAVAGAPGSSDTLPQLLVANGIATLNTVQVTPMMDVWEKIDPTGKWEDIYNRYAFISLGVTETTESSPFTLVAPDRIRVALNAEQLELLGVTYVLAQEDLTLVRCQEACFVSVAQPIDGWSVYRIE